MATEQSTTSYKGVNIAVPVLPVELHVMPDFTGRVVLYIENGRVKADRRLRDEEHICAIDTFIEMAREMGLQLNEVAN
ncbi:hypothetical protein [Dryocola clanedunensis]|uniref:hypothetical protein n=1 Tax=Cedecea sulfonylureivorans TaxID=3051154 RepID=UPI001925A15E|nr:hypothetical protein [Cedecea sulfonylureivorans]